MLINFFTQSGRRIAQISGMDETGTDVSLVEGFDPITMDRVIGRPEEIYWEKVPVKVKKLAVEKAINLVAADQRGEDRPDTTTWDGIQRLKRGFDEAGVIGGSPREKKRRK